MSAFQGVKGALVTASASALEAMATADRLPMLAVVVVVVVEERMNGFRTGARLT
jgi:hypothetical protein